MNLNTIYLSLLHALYSSKIKMYLLADYRRYELASCKVDHTQVHDRAP